MLNDLRLALRNLIRQPRYALVSVGSIACGIAAVTAIFGFVYGVLLAPLPFAGSERVVVIHETERGEETGGNPLRMMDWLAAPSVESVAGFYGENYTLAAGDTPLRVAGVRTFGDIVRTVGLQAAKGRVFTAEEMAGIGRVVLISHELWHGTFASDPGIVGRAIQLNGEPYEVIGVLPRGADFEGVRIFAAEPGPHRFPRSARFIMELARLREGATPAQFSSELRTVAARLASEYPQTDRHVGTRVEPWRDHVAGEVRRPMLALFGAVVFVLLMACLNIANLAVSRAAGREGELAVRQALGAGRARLARLLFAESAAVALVGGLLGAAGAAWALDLLKAIAPEGLPRLAEVRFDARVAAFAALAAFASAVIAGSLPAWRYSSVDVSGRLKKWRRHRLQSALVLAQVALSLTLVAGSGLLFRSLWNLRERPLGFAPERVLSFRLSLPWQAGPEQIHGLYERVLARLRAMPGVEGVALTDRLPLDGETMSSEVYIPGRVDLPEGARIGQRVVSPDFHRVMRAPLLAGRHLSEDDLTKQRAVINEAARRAYFRGRDPLGAKVGLKWSKPAADDRDTFEIVGVVGDVPETLREAKAAPSMYVTYKRSYWPLAHFVIRTRVAPDSLAAAVRREVAAVDSTRAIERVQTVEDSVSSRSQTPRLQAWTIAVFAAASLLLSAIGVYGLVAAGVVERAREIGIRMALGAEPGQVARAFVARSLRLAAGGSAAGVVLSLGVAKWIESELFGVAAFDWRTYAGSLCVLLAVSLAAAWFPARKAARLDPMSALRRE